MSGVASGVKGTVLIKQNWFKPHLQVVPANHYKVVSLSQLIVLFFLLFLFFCCCFFNTGDCNCAILSCYCLFLISSFLSVILAFPQ